MREQLVEEISEYLEKQVGANLRNGLQALWREKPAHPTEWLGQWLVANSGFDKHSNLGNVVATSATEILLCLSVKDDKVFCGYRGGVVKIWDATTSKWADTIMSNHVCGAYSILVEGNNCYVGEGGKGDIKLWELKAGKAVHYVTFEGHSSNVFCLRTSGDVLYSASGDCTVKGWPKQGGAAVKTFKGHTRPIWNLLFDRAGRMVTASVDKTVRVWNAADGECIQTIECSSSVCSMHFNGDHLLLGCDQVIQVRNSTDSYQLLNSVEAHAGYVRSLLVVGEKLFSGGMNRDVKIWDVKSMTLIKTIAEDADTQSFPVSTLVQSGKHVLCALSDRLIIMHDQ